MSWHNIPQITKGYANNFWLNDWLMLARLAKSDISHSFLQSMLQMIGCSLEFNICLPKTVIFGSYATASDATVICLYCYIVRNTD